MKQFLNFPALIITVVVACNLFFISCKEDNNDPAESSKPLLATMASYSEDGTLLESESYSYDTKGRLIEMNNNDSYKVVFEYSPSTITIKEYDEGVLEYLATATLNSQSLCTSSLSAEDGATAYTYDTNGYRKGSVKESSNSTFTQTFTVDNQNYVTIAYQSVVVSPQSAKVKIHNFLGKLGMKKADHHGITNQNILKSASDQVSNYKIDFQFYTDKVNTIDLENMGISFLGKQNKNPVMQEIETSDEWPAHITNYTYDYDTKGRITRKIDTQGNYQVYTYVE